MSGKTKLLRARRRRSRSTGYLDGTIAIVTGAAGGSGKTIAAEFGCDGIRCNAICPGFVRTEMHLDATRRLAAQEGIGEAEMAARRYAGVPLGRAGDPDEIARLAVFLAGPGGAYITGTAIPVAGGHPVGL